MIKLIKKIKIKDIFFLIIILAIFKFFNTPYNLYSILKWNHNSRLEQTYGFCEKESWGFYNLINKRFNLKDEKIRIINDEGYVTLEQLFNFNAVENENTRYLIFLNYKSENNQDIFNSKYDFVENYKIKYRYNNCYLLELND